MGYRTPGLTATYLLGKQDKHVGLEEAATHEGWWDAPLALRDLAETVCMYAKI